MTTAATRSRTLAASSTEVFHALSDETRLAIVEMLRGGERCVCDLQAALDAAQSRLSFHLKVLKDAGLVTDRKQGRWSYYTLNVARLAEASDVLAELATPVASRGGLQLHPLARAPRASASGEKSVRVARPRRAAESRDGCC